MRQALPNASDIPVGGWMDRLIPGPVRPYLRLARLDRPIGTWLLLFPCWWSTALAASGWPDPWLMILFAIGALVMRGAGCTINDLADRDFDGRVARTADRPIPSGAVSVPQALLFLAFELALGLLVLMQLGDFAIKLGIASLVLVVSYPFAKRVTYWPQVVLGLAFNYGALMGWAAVHGRLDPPAILLYAAGIFWTLGYDTIYAHQDREDDLLVGIKSTALRLGEATPRWLVGFSVLTIALMAGAGWTANLTWPFHGGLVLAAGHLAWQIRRLDIDDPKLCLILFKSNRAFGWIVLAAIIAGRVVA